MLCSALHMDKDKSTSTTHTTGTTGHSTTGHSTTSGTSEGVAGPHGSRIANAADPRVDSDMDGSRNAGASHGTHTTGSGLTGNTHGSGLTGNNHSTHTGTGIGGTTHSGTHMGNTHGTHTGTTGGLSSSTNAGPHDSNMMNKVDPRVDSDLDGRGNRHGAATGGLMGASGSHATAGSGTAQNTAGPHNSDMMNKVDPRVDSDRDGSKTVGGNKTHA